MVFRYTTVFKRTRRQSSTSYMKGVQQCRDVQADFVCKLEKEQVDAFEVYPNTVRLNLLNGCPSRPPLRLCCIFFVFIYDYRRFSHISVHSKRKKNFPTTPSYSVCFCEYTRRQAIPGLCGHPQGLRQQLTQKASQGVGRERGWVGGGAGETREGTISLFPFIFFLQTPPLPRPLPNLRLPRRLLTTVPQYTVRFPMLGPEVSMF